MDPGFLVYLTQRRLFFGFTVLYMSFWESYVSGNICYENIFSLSAIIGEQYCPAALFIVTHKLRIFSLKKSFGHFCNVRLVKYTVFLSRYQYIVLCSRFVVRHCYNLCVKFVYGKILSYEYNLFYSALADGCISKIKISGKTSA